ncbi:hypothetical protein MUP46_00365 [Patescibacteria group bacterium]|nr:hypothetical protein [Patescibacteria group bacterium]
MPEIIETNPSLYELSPRDLLRECIRTGEKVSRTEWIPVSDVIVEDTPIDEAHALDLGRAMTGEWGQTQDTLHRAIEGSGEFGVSYETLDGFHRVAGLKMVTAEISSFLDPISREKLSRAVALWKQTPLRSTVLYGCSEEEKYDQRILAVNSVKSVRFARLAYWMKGAWRETLWKDLISVTQAFGIATNDSSGFKLGLERNDADLIKEWVRRKASAWLMEPGNIYFQLRTLDMADPYLVLRVRTGSFIKGGLALTPPQFNKIVDGFPNNFQAQRAIAEYSNRCGLTTPQIAWLVDSLRKLEHHNEQTVKNELQRIAVPNKDSFTIKHIPVFPERHTRESDRTKELALGQDIRGVLRNIRGRISKSSWPERKKQEVISAIDVLLNRL